MMMIIGFIGDCHGNWSDLAIAMLRLQDCDNIVQVGDFGFWPPIIKELEVSRPIYFIDGNHEHFPFLWERVDRNILKPQEVHPNVFYLPRGTVVEWGGMRFGCMGGAVSIDRQNRKEGIDWFPEEVASYSEMMKLMTNESPIDVIIAHDCPNWAIENRLSHKNDDSSLAHRKMMDRMCQAVNPSFWVHGHYHFRNHVIHPNFGWDCMGLGCAPECIIFDTENKCWESVEGNV